VIGPGIRATSFSAPPVADEFARRGTILRSRCEHIARHRVALVIAGSGELRSPADVEVVDFPVDGGLVDRDEVGSERETLRAADEPRALTAHDELGAIDLAVDLLTLVCAERDP
jgi:hypothetical protein